MPRMSKCFGSLPLLQTNPESKFLAENTALKNQNPSTLLYFLYSTQQICNSRWMLEELSQ